MSSTSHLSIAAFVSENERSTVQSATDLIARALGETSDRPWSCDCVFSPDLATLPRAGEATTLVTSLLPELDRLDAEWPQTERRLRAAYVSLCEGGSPVFICTILRHIPHEKEPKAANALRLGIRRLNLLAAEISHQTGAFVIDLDRALADIGARRLETDYRLSGNAATGMAGHFIALHLVDHALEAFVPVEVLEKARAFLTSHQPVAAKRTGIEITMKQETVALGRGRRKQIVMPITHTIPENYSGFFVRQVLRGEMGPRDALEKLFKVVRGRGVRETAGLCVSGLLSLAKRKQ